jgi:uncharacterized membrane protein
VLLILLQIYFLIREIKLFYKYSKDEPLPKINLSGRIWEPPSDIDPAQIEQLLSGTKSLTPKAFTATILSLVHDRVFKFERSHRKEGLIFKNYHYYLVPINENKDPLSTIQSYVLTLISKAGTSEVDLGEGKTTVIGLNDIVNYVKRHRESSYKFFKDFPDIVLEENLNEKYFDRDAHNFKIGWGIADSVLTLFGSIFGLVAIADSPVHSLLFVPVIGILLSLTGIKISALLYHHREKRTEKGSLETAQWLAFKKHMEEYQKTKNYPIDSIVLWEKYLVYGTVLGISAKALSQFPIKFPEHDQKIATMYWGGVFSSGSFSNGMASLSSLSHVSTALIKSIISIFF